MARKYKEIAEFLEGVRFRYRMVGGVDEEDVWKVFQQLHGEYDELLAMQHQYTIGAIVEWRNYALLLQKLLLENHENIKLLAVEWNQIAPALMEHL